MVGLFTVESVSRYFLALVLRYWLHWTFMCVSSALFALLGLALVRKASSLRNQQTYNFLFTMFYVISNAGYVVLLWESLTMLQSATNRLMVSMRGLLYLVTSIMVLRHVRLRTFCRARDLGRLYSVQLRYNHSVICAFFLVIEAYFVTFGVGRVDIMILSSYVSILAVGMQWAMVLLQKRVFGFLLTRQQCAKVAYDVTHTIR